VPPGFFAPAFLFAIPLVGGYEREMAPVYDRQRLKRISQRWLGYNALAIAAFLPFYHVFEGRPVSLLLLALLVIVAQACCLHRVCRWWLWIPVSCAGCYASNYCGMYYWAIAFGGTMSLAQGVCLISWSLRTAATWALLGSLGWIAGAMATGVFEEVFVLLGLERHDAFAVWVCIFSVQSFFFLPAVIMLDKAALAQADKLPNESSSGSGA
jgi:hypothetical protein